MKIGVIGAGNVGGTLGRRWAGAGHEVMFGVRDPGSARTRALLHASGPTAQAGSVEQAASFGDVVAIAVHWNVLPDVLRQLGNLHGKTVIDCTNRMGPPSPGSAPTAGEEVARLLPGANVVKAFNTLGAEHLNDPNFHGEAASMFIAGDDATAKRQVAQLAQDLGFEAVDAGPLSNAGLLETLTRVWLQLSRVTGRGIAFRLLRR